MNCTNCRYCMRLGKIYVCHRWKAEIEPKPKTICDKFIKREYKIPDMGVKNDNLHDDNAEELGE